MSVLSKLEETLICLKAGRVTLALSRAGAARAGKLPRPADLRRHEVHRLRRLRQQLSGARNSGVRRLPGDPHPAIPRPPLHLLRALRRCLSREGHHHEPGVRDRHQQDRGSRPEARSFHEHLPALRPLLQRRSRTGRVEDEGIPLRRYSERALDLPAHAFLENEPVVDDIQIELD